MSNYYFQFWHGGHYNAYYCKHVYKRLHFSFSLESMKNKYAKCRSQSLKAPFAVREYIFMSGTREIREDVKCDKGRDGEQGQERAGLWRKKGKEEEKGAGLMQPAAKKRPSFVGERSALREKENKAKS